jgi:tetratricopeptide (TPR) repeat protein
VIRSSGPYETYYASTLAAALRIFSEKKIDIIFSEYQYSDGNIVDLKSSIGENHIDDDVYLIFAVEEKSEAYIALSQEVCAQDLVVKPMTANNIRESLVNYQKWKVRKIEPWEEKLRQAAFAIKEKKFSDADRFFLDAIKLSPENYLPLYRAGIYYLKKNELGLAESLLKKAMDMNYDFIPTASALGHLYLLKKDIAKAEHYLHQAAVVSTLNNNRPLELGNLFIEKAMAICREALNKETPNPEIRFLYAKLLAVQKDYVGALREFKVIMPELRDKKRLEAQTFMALAKKIGGISE